MVKIYTLIWVLGILAAAGFYVTGNLTPVIAVVFGFLTFGAIFMGMMSILPATVVHQHHPSKK